MIDRNKQNEIIADIDAALAEVARKHGLTKPIIDVRRATNGTFVRLMKLDMYVEQAGSQAVEAPVASLGNTPLDRALARLGIKSKVNAKGEMIIDYKPSRPKYPFVFQGARGGRWKATEYDIKARFA